LPYSLSLKITISRGCGTSPPANDFIRVVRCFIIIFDLEMEYLYRQICRARKNEAARDGPRR